MNSELNWSPPDLTTDDQVLVDAYREIGIALDDLPYTNDFDRLCAMVDSDRHEEPSFKHALWKRLLSLRKRGWLPRLFLREDQVKREAS